MKKCKHCQRYIELTKKNEKYYNNLIYCNNECRVNSKDFKHGCSKGGKNVQKILKERQISAFYDKEIQSENRKKAAITNEKNKTGFWSISKENRVVYDKRAAITNKKNNTGFWGISKEDKIINSRKAGKLAAITNKKNKTGFWHPSKYVQFNSVKSQKKNKTGFYNSETQRQISIKGWSKKTTEEREEWVSNALKGLHKRPTFFEKRIAELCIEHSLPFIYTGDGRFLINFKNPDFTNYQDKVVIEVFYSWFKIRDYGSVENYKEFCRKKYNPKGWKVIFIDENEVMNDDYEHLCLQKILEVIEK